MDDKLKNEDGQLWIDPALEQYIEEELNNDIMVDEDLSAVIEITDILKKYGF